LRPGIGILRGRLRTAPHRLDFLLRLILPETIDAFCAKRHPNPGIFHQEHQMNEDQVKGRAKQAEGQTKKTLGKVTGNKSLEERGKLQKGIGKAQSDIGDLRENLKDSLKDDKR